MTIDQGRKAFVFALLFVGIALAGSLAALSATAGQDVAGPWWEVRTIETADLGIPGPLGLAFSDAANAFLVPVPPAGSPEAASSELALISPSEELVGSTQLATTMPDPLNL